ncbi:MAG TPA: RNB domain-containing ribonuclease [Candidatus Acidoferrales bacterium]|nr:RNB domain-containing ribonuclease [Candidatus Acidoferrales bacterium]
MPRTSNLSPENLLRFLQVKTEPVSANEIARGLNLGKSDRRPLFKILTKLKKRNAIEELPGSRYRVAKRNAAKESSAIPQSKRRPGDKQIDVAQIKDTQTKPARNLLARDEIKGRLVLHHDGYGFVVPSTPVPQLDGDLFIPPNAINSAMHGDQVIAKIKPAYGVTGVRRAEGAIVRILGRAHATVVGLFRYGSSGNVVLPYDIRIQNEIEIPPGDESTPELRKKLGLPGTDHQTTRPRRVPVLPELDGAVVDVELTRYARGGAPPTGRVVEILGRPGDLGVDIEIIIRKHHIPHTFSAEVLQEAARRAVPITEAEHQGREDFRALPIVTIDGETARDFDDAVYVERRPDGGWHLQVHIADVSHYVRTESPLDQEARLRGTSVYFPDRAVPMLPESLSNGMCSLKPHEDRLVMSALMEFDPVGNMRSARMTPGIIRSFERMTYTNVNKVIEKDPEMTARYAPLAKHFANMKELALLLNARRNEHGSIDFDLPEQVIEFDDQQRMVSIGRSVRNIAHRLIEEFMLAANRAVASYLLQRGINSLHRVHEKPDARKVLEFEELARAFGYSLGVENLQQREIAVRHGRTPAPARAGRPDSYGHGRERPMKVALPGGVDLNITPQHYQRLIRKVTGKPEERIISYLMLRSLKQARYAAEPLGHFALGFDEYTHFTSPIRRYPDLIVHRILKWALEHPEAKPQAATPSRASQWSKTAAAALTSQNEEAKLYSQHQLEEIAAESSEAERRATGAERELMDWKTAQFMEQHLGEEYDALIISVQKFGCFVELFEVFVEGLLPISALEEAAGTRVVFREHDHAIVSLPGGAEGPRGGRRRDSPGRGRGTKPKQLTWSLGDQVRVRAERIDPMRKRVEFALATSPQ